LAFDRQPRDRSGLGRKGGLPARRLYNKLVLEKAGDSSIGPGGRMGAGWYEC